METEKKNLQIKIKQNLKGSKLRIVEAKKEEEGLKSRNKNNKRAIERHEKRKEKMKCWLEGEASSAVWRTTQCTICI